MVDGCGKGGSVIRRTPIKRRSVKKQKADKVYAKVRREVLECAPYCAVNGPDCSIHATETHHIKSRAQGGKHEMANLLPVCRECHEWLPRNRAIAIKRGWIIEGRGYLVSEKGEA
jgi:5-methylcytosine-specific restriction endonuclease McrA